ncbi:hypothetical protein F4861DRAFT_501780 [Xylaria intraflava]|nr:hypothetical protein F4861DRAFT_501780 [Xylaria intraflava]
MADMADMQESDGESGIPAPSLSEPSHTPQRQRHTRLDSRTSHNGDDSDASATDRSPPAPRSMKPDTSPLSPLRRRSSLTMSQSSPLYPQWDEDRENITQDSRDALVRRLNDLAARLSQECHVEDESINLLHVKIDDLENALDTPETHQYKAEKKRSRPRPLTPGADQDESVLSWMAHHPANLLPSDASSLSSSAPPSPSAKARVGHRGNPKTDLRTSKMTVAQAERVLAEAHNLHKDLETVISNLQDRQEETEHIHELMITRLERAAQRIIYLEERVRYLESKRKESGTEILNLRIQLKAIEVQCLSYVPREVDQELHESIDAWKSEWSALKQKRARNDEQPVSTPTRHRATPTTD